MAKFDVRQAGMQAVPAAVLFFLLANPWIFDQVDMLFDRVGLRDLVKDSDKITTAGVAIHTAVYVLVYMLLSYVYSVVV